MTMTPTTEKKIAAYESRAHWCDNLAQTKEFWRDAKFNNRQGNTCALCQLKKITAHDCSNCLQLVAEPADSCVKEWKYTGRAQTYDEWTAACRGMIAVIDRYIEYLKSQDKAEPEVFEGEVRVNKESFGMFKLISTEMGCKPGDLIWHPVHNDNYYYPSPESNKDWTRYDFATNAERSRFEQVRLARSRKGQRFEGKILEGSFPAGSVFVYTGDYLPPGKREPFVSCFGYANIEEEGYYECRHILRLVEPEPEVKLVDKWWYWDEKYEKLFRYGTQPADARLRPATLDDLAVDLGGRKMWAREEEGLIRIGMTDMTGGLFYFDDGIPVAAAIGAPVICAEQWANLNGEGK